MPVGFFVDKDDQPTMGKILAAIGSKRYLWDRLTRFVEDNYRPQKEFRFYGKNYGWALRFRKSGKALLSVYPGKDSFTAQVIISDSQAEKALGMNLGENARKVIENSHPFPEGRWLFLKVESQIDLSDVQRLLMVKLGASEKGGTDA